MLQSEKELLKNSSKVMRAARKSLGLRQTQVCKRLGISQSALSKLENEVLIPSAPLWLAFCEIFNVPVLCLKSGFIDRELHSFLRSGSSEEGFKVPKKYNMHKGSKVRALRPIIDFFESELGEEKLVEFLKENKLDPDFFTIYDNQINLDFFISMTSSLVTKGKLNSKNVSKLAKYATYSKNHGNIWNKLSTTTDPIIFLDETVRNSKLYECNFKYQVEDKDKNSIHISVSPEEHLDAFSYIDHDILGNFFGVYKREYLRQVASSRTNKPVDIEELESLGAGGDKWLFKIKTA